MKKSYRIILSAAAVITLLVSFTACAGKTEAETSATTGTGNVQMPNPILDHKSLDEAWKVLGFEFETPSKLPEGYVQDGIMTISAELGQVIYKNVEKVITFRAAKGNKDISGDYNEYKSIQTKKISGMDVTLKGNDDKVFLAIWTDHTCSYSVAISEGMSEELVTEIVLSITR